MSDQPEQQAPTWRQRLAQAWQAVRSWWKRANRRIPITALITMAALCVGTVLLYIYLPPEPVPALASDVDALDARVAALEAAPVTAVCDPVQINVPAPAPTRTPAARVVPTPAEPAPTTSAWSQPTDLNRAIDRFTTTLQEPTQ